MEEIERDRARLGQRRTAAQMTFGMNHKRHLEAADGLTGAWLAPGSQCGTRENPFEGGLMKKISVLVEFEAQGVQNPAH